MPTWGRFPAAAFLALLPIVLAPRVAAAQQPDSAAAPQAADTPVATIPEIRVEVSRLSVGGVAASRVPFFVSLRSGDEIRTASTLTIADALSGLPGVHANDELGAAAQPDITLRGFSVSPVVGLPQSLSVFVDGVRVNEPDAAQVHFDLIPLNDIERVEVIRGPSGPYGRNTLAGAVNIVTRRGGPQGERELALAAGSFETLEARGRASGTAGPIDYYASGRYLRAEGWREVTGARLLQVFGKLGYRGTKSDVWVSYSFALDSIEQAGSLPRSWLEGSLPAELSGTADPRKLNFTGGDFFLPLQHFFTGSFSRQLNSELTSQTVAFFRRNEIDQFNANITEANSRGLSDLWSAGVTSQLTYRPQPDLILLGGLEYVRDDVDARIFAEPNDAAADSGLTTHVRTEQDDFGAFLQAWWAPRSALSILGSVRFDAIRIPFRDLLDPSNDGTNTFQQVTTSLGADYVVSNAVTLYASYGHGFRAPVILELACADPEDPCPLPFELGADPPLKPVTTDTWQAGLRLIPSARTQVEIAGYLTEVRDEIFNVVAVSTTRGFFQNIRRTRRQGFELRGELQPLPFLRLSGDIAYTRATFQSRATLAAPFLDDEEGTDGGGGTEPDPPSVEPGDRFPLIPKLRANLGIGIRHDGWGLGLEGSYAGSQWLRGDEGNTRSGDKLDPYFLVDLSAERAIGPAYLYARLDNIFDSRYESFGVLANNPKVVGEPVIEPFLTPGFPRRIFAGVGWRW